LNAGLIGAVLHCHGGIVGRMLICEDAATESRVASLTVQLCRPISVDRYPF
jgi:hypothetical protein